MATAAHKPLAAITADDLAAAGAADAAALHSAVRSALGATGARGPATVWAELSRAALRPEVPFAVHRMLYYGCYAGSPSPTPPAWTPDPDEAALTNVGRVLVERGRDFIGEAYKDPVTSFRDFHKFSNENPQAYWKMVFEEMGITFSVEPSCILRDSDVYPGGEWLPGAVLNAAANCLSAKPGRNSSDVAIVWRDEGKDSEPLNLVTLEELRKRVCLVANALDALDLAKGSAIAIDMPMNVNAVVIYLAIVLAGYIVVSIADSFAAPAISTRLKISEAKAIFTQDCILRDDKELPLYSRVVEAKAPMAIVIPARGPTPIKGLRTDDLSWQDFLGRADCTKADIYTAVEQPAYQFSNILFSSGTTGEPKAIPWTHLTPLKAAADGWCHMDIRKGDVVAWPTNLGWMMGPWLVYASLLNGASMALYNGSPNSSGFAKFVQDAKVTMLGVVPSIVRTWKNTDCTAGFDWSTIRCFSSTGEASSVDDYLWLMGRACYKPVIEYCGGTEIGGGFVTGSLLQPQALSAFSTPAMGCNLFILDSSGNPLPQDSAGIGELALDPTLFGSSTTLLNADHHEVYFSGMPEWNGKVLRRHGDEFERTADGYYRAHGRADDTMNLGGIKVSSIEIERICNRVSDAILETAAIGVPPVGGGPEKLTIAVVFKDQSRQAEDLNQLKLVFNSALKKLNPLFKVSSVILVPSLPHTPTPGKGSERGRQSSCCREQSARMRSGGGGGMEDEEAGQKLKSMDVNKLEKKGGNGGSSSSSDEDSPHPPRPAVKYHGWKAMPFIIGNETFEKLGTLGTSANLLVYLTQVFHMRSVDAATLLNGLNGTTSLAPIVGAFLSDAYLGRYLALAIASVASLFGMFFLTLTAAADTLHPPECNVGDVCQKATSYQFAVLFIAFAFLVLGSAGIRPCSMPFGADQFDPHTESGKRGINSFFNWYYFTFTTAMLISATVIIYVQSNVNWALGLGIPTALMFLACVLFFMGTKLYVRVVPEGSPFTTIVQVFCAAVRKRSLKQAKDPKQDLFDPPHTSNIVTKLAHTDQFRCLDKAAMVASPEEVRAGGAVAADPWRLCTVQQVEEVKCLIRIVPVWSTGIIYYVAVVQQSTYVVFSALQSDRLLVPRLRKVTGKDEGFTLLQRQGIGIALSTVAMVISAIVEDRRRSIALNQSVIGHTQTGGGISAMSSFWMVPQLMILGLSEAFNLISQIEFYYKEIPEHMRSVAGALAFCNLALGNYLSGFLTTIVNSTTARGQNWLAQDLNQGRLDLFYWTIAGIGVFNFVYFIICARWYRFKGASN